MFSTDSGTLGDGLTNDNTLTLSGTAAANSIVKVLEGTTQVGQATADGSGAWSVTTSVLPDGSHSFTATATSGGTTSGSSSPFSVQVDTVAPRAPTIASFSTDTGTVGDRITSDNTLTLTGAAAANSAVKVYDGAMLLGSATANGSGAWSYTTGVLSNALHNLTATATDAAGNTSAASSVLAVTVTTAGTGATTFTGTNGNDMLPGTIGADVMTGLGGNDTYTVNNSGDKVVELANQGTDVVVSTIHFSLPANVETLVLQGSADLQGYGNAQANTLYGNTGNNLLNGGAGADTMLGGAGNDTYFVDNVGDIVFENPNEGNDAVFSTVNYTLTANVETLVLQGTGNLSGTGNALNNTIHGNDGNNTLNGGAGADVLVGHAGNDTFVFNVGQANGDTVFDFDGQGADTGDSLRFVGYGPGATFTQNDATHWQINYNGGTAHEIITLSNAASIHASDFVFV
jgi:Ca2+-binding RTX toxin-like protein